jgi:REP-associated tyrosine transposase
MKAGWPKKAGDNVAREMKAHRTPRRRSIRLRGYDDSQQGMYFITICTAGRAVLFGDVMGGTMRLNDAGRTVRHVWRELPGHYFGLETDACVVMPNHVHGVIVLTDSVGAGSPRPSAGAETAPLRATLGQVVARFKYESTKLLNAMRGRPGERLWQRGYYEHIIRHGESLHDIRRYIVENPARWESDPENPQAARPRPADACAHP